MMVNGNWKIAEEANATKWTPMKHKSNIHSKSQWKRNHNYSLRMRHLFVTKWLIAWNTHKHDCDLAAQQQTMQTSARAQEHKQKRTEDNGNTQQQAIPKRMQKPPRSTTKQNKT